MQTSHKTAIHRNKPSLTVRMIENFGLIKNRVFDFGCGTGKDVRYLKSKGFDVGFWDPFYFKEKSLSDFKPNSFQTVLCTYVLNVIHKDERIDAIGNIKKLLHKDGTVFFTVRTTQDILEKAKKNSWKQSLDGWITQKTTFQKGFTPEELELLIRDNGFRNVQTISKNPLIVKALPKFS